MCKLGKRRLVGLSMVAMNDNSDVSVTTCMVGESVLFLVPRWAHARSWNRDEIVPP